MANLLVRFLGAALCAFTLPALAAGSVTLLRPSAPGAKATLSVGSFGSIAAALAAADPGDEVVLGAQVYLESGLLIEDNDLVLRGFADAEGDGNAWTRELVSVIDGQDANRPIIRLANGVSGVTLRNLHLRNVNHNCVQGLAANHGTVLDRNLIEDCRADLVAGNVSPDDPRGGVFFNGPVDGIRFLQNEVRAVAPRALVIWNGFKTNIVFDGNYVHDTFGCCGIELQDGTSSGVTVVNNRIERTPDNGIGLVGLTGGAGAPSNGANRIADNLVLNTGRFGIEIKLPNGSGLATGNGSIVVENNGVYLSSAGDPDFDGNVLEHTLAPGIAAYRPNERRDLAGIAVMRRSVADAANVDVPSGVVVRGNIVGGWQQDVVAAPASVSTGFGIVVAGVKHTVFNNTLVQNDVGVQRQAGHGPYCSLTDDPAPQDLGLCDGNQNDVPDQFFGRDNTQRTCAAVGSNVFTNNIEATDRSVVANAGVLVDASVFNEQTTLGYCSLQAAIDDPLTQDGHTLRLADGAVFAESVVVHKRLRLTRNNAGAVRPRLQAPAGPVPDLAIVRVRAANVEIDNLDFVVDLARVGEAIRTVGGTAGANPDGISIHDNTITATASAAPFVAYGRRNAISLNLSAANNYALPNEQETTLTVDVRNNTIGGTQDWDAVTGGNQPAFFRSAIGIDQGEGVIAGNTLRGRDYDLFVRYTNGAAGLDIGLATPGGANTFAGGGLYVGDGIADVRVTANVFSPDRSLQPFDAPFAGTRWGDLGTHGARLVNSSDTVVLAGNTFSGHSNAVFAQNFVDLDLLGNTFNAPPALEQPQFRHLILSTKVVSTSSHSVTQVPLAVDATSNAFDGGSSPGQTAIAVELVNHDSDADLYGTLNFGGSAPGERNTFGGEFDWYFRLDPQESGSAPAPYSTYYLLGSASATMIAPFAGDVQAQNNLFAGQLPSLMDFAQVQALQARTFHDDPDAPEASPVPADLGRVHYGFAAGVIPTTTTVSTAPAPSAVNAPFDVTVVVTNGLGANPAGTLLVSADGGLSCPIVGYPVVDTCQLPGYPTGGVRSVTATFTADDAVHAASTGATTHAVTYPAGPLTVTPAASPTAADNDYTRINNAVRSAGPGVVISLQGTFDFSPDGLRAPGSNPDPLSHAWNSFRAGSNGVFDDSHINSPTRGDDWSIRVPAGVNGFTLTAPAAGAATIRAPGDLAIDGGASSVFLAARDPLSGPGRTFQDITVSNLLIEGFDAGVFFRNGGFFAETFSGSRIVGNEIRVPAALEASVKRGIYVGYGANQWVRDNVVRISLAGSVAGATYSGIQAGDSSNTNAFDGLLIAGNDVLVTGAPVAVPSLIAIWENAGDGDSQILIEDNAIVGSGNLGGGVENNGQYGIVATTQSNGGKTSRVRRNDVRGVETGLIGQLPQYGHFVSSDGALRIENNTFVANGTALHLAAAYSNQPGSNFAKYAVHGNRIAGNLIGLLAERADDLPAAGDPGYGGDELPSQIDARDNWWGCNAGPADALCDDVSVDASVPGETAAVDQSSWLILRGEASPSTIAPNAPSAITVDLLANNAAGTPGVGFPDGTAISLTTTKGTLAPAAPFATLGGEVETTLTNHASGYAFLTASLDNQEVDFAVVVPGPVTVSKGLGMHLDARATCAAPDFDTVQDAIATVPADTEILVCSGVYAEDVTVDKRVVLLGAQAGADARNRAVPAGDEAVLVPATVAPGMSLNAFTVPVVDVTADGVRMDGFVIDGNNPALASGVLLNGADVDRPDGIDTDADGFELRNTILRNFVFAGLYAVDGGGALVTRNRFDNITAPGGYGLGVYAGNNYYVRLIDNLMASVTVGLQTGNNHLPAPAGFVPVASGNTIHAASSGIFHNLAYGTATAYALTDNTIVAQANPARTGQWRGIWLESLQTAQVATVQGNTITGAAVNATRQAVGYLVNNLTTTQAANIAIEGSAAPGADISDVDVGVLSTDAAFYTGPVNDIVVRNLAFGAGVGTALYVEDSTEVAGSARLTIGPGIDFGPAGTLLAVSGVAPTVAYTGGAANVQSILVRSSRNYFYGLNAAGGSPCTVCTVPSAPINPAIAAVATGGTVTLEAGVFPHAIAANKAFSLIGPHAGTAGNGAGRGTGEATITPAAATTALSISASNVIVDGVEFADITHDRIVTKTGGGTLTGVRIANSRFDDFTSTSGNGGGFIVGGTAGLVIEDNLFEDFANGSGFAMGIKLDGNANPQVLRNVFNRVQSVAMQFSQATTALVSGNVVDGGSADYTNAGIQVFTSSNVTVEGNTFDQTAQGLLFMRGNTNLRFTCNIVSQSQRGVRAAVFGTVGSETSPAIFHNVLPATGSVVNEWSSTLVVGSNYYGGGAAAVSGSAPALVADALAASPIGQAACGDNTATQHVLVSGTGQVASLNLPFAQPLRSRVQDALGGAVMGHDVTITAPASGASALLTPASGTLQDTDYNGAVQATAIANGFAGNYNVVAAAAGLGNVAFALQNTAPSQVFFDLNGPIGGVQVGEPVAYSAALRRDSAPVTEQVRIEVVIGGVTPPATLELCLDDGAGCTPLALTPVPGGLGAQSPAFTMPNGFDEVFVFRAVFPHGGIFTASARVVGDSSGTVYASDVLATEVVAQHAGVTVGIDGPVAGVERGEPTDYTVAIGNSAASVADDVFVELVFTRDGGDWAPGELSVEQVGFGPLVLTVDGLDPSVLSATLNLPSNQLPAGTDITAGLRITHNVVDTYQIVATVRDRLDVTDTDGVDPYAADLHEVTVIEPDPAVALTLSGGFAPADGTTPQAAQVAQPVVVRAELVNAGGQVPDEVRAAVTFGANFTGIEASDVVASYWFVAGPSAQCSPVDANDRTPVTFADDGDTLSAVTSGTTMTAGFELAACFHLEFARAGVYNLGAVIEDANGDSDGRATYAADNLSLAVTQSDATIALGGLGSFQFNGAPRAATATTMPAGLPVDITYALANGPASATAPVEAGVYTVTATIAAGQPYEGTASGTITITPRPVTIVLNGTGDSIYDGNPRVATASITPAALPAFPLGAPLQVTYNGLAAAPTEAGAYVVTAFFDPALVRNYTALPAVGSIGILKRDLAVTLDPTDLQQSFGSTRAVDTSIVFPPSPASQSVVAVDVTYDGSSTVPTAIGTYAVLARIVDYNYEGSVSGTLVVSDGAAVSLALDPLPAMALVGAHTPGFTDPMALQATVANAGTATSQPVHYRLRIVRLDDGNGSGGDPVAIVPDDVKVCVYDPSGYAAQAPNHDGCPVDFQYLFETVSSLDGRPAVELRYPNLPANDVVLPPLGPTPLPGTLRLRPGEYRMQIDVVGSTTGAVYASATSDSTTVPNAMLAYSGATSGAAEEVLISQTRLRNTGGRVDGNVIVRITLSDAAATPSAPIVLSGGAAELLYQLGADYQTLPWQGNAADGGLVTYFGPPVTGFALEDGHDATTAGAGVFHRLGNYRLRYEVLDIGFATTFAQTDVPITIAANAVNFALSDLSQVYDGTPRAVTVSPSAIPHTVTYEALAGASCPSAPVAGSTTPPTDAGSWCVYVQATGNYTGSASGTLVITPATAAVTIDGAVAGVVQRAFDGSPQAVTASSTPTVAGFAIIYNGSSTAPTAAGSYSVLATVADPNYTGSASATLVIAIDGGATIVLDDDDGTVDNVVHRTYDGDPQVVTATATPAIAYQLTYRGVGTTSYPLTATAPVDAGEYEVIATTTDANYAPVTATGMLIVEPATAGIAIDPASLAATHDGSPHAVDVTTTPAGLEFTVTYNGGGVPTAAGSYAVVVSIVERNYVGTANATLVISQSAGNLSAADVSVTYDGLPHGVTVVNPDAIAFTVAYEGTTAAGAAYGPTATAPTDAGSYVATITETDPDFAQAPFTATVEIARLPVTVAFGNLSHVYDGSAKSASVSTTPAGVPGVSLAYAPDAAPTNAGSYTVTASIASANYLLSDSDVTTLVIARATAQVTLSDLTRLYDGAPKPVTVTTVPGGLGEATTVTYDGSATAPSAVGNYAVVATVNHLNYTGSASGTLSILAAAIADLEVEGGASFTGIAGLPLAGARPSVQVLDANGNGVPSVTVQFDVASGGGSGGGSVATDANGLATVPAWTLGADAGANTMTARVSGLAGLPTLTFTAQGTESTDLSVAIEANRSRMEAGQQVVYTITVANAGPSNAAEVAIANLLPAEVASATWTCSAAAGALCGVAATANGSGDVDLDARLPAGSSLVIVVTATVATDAPIGLMDNTATVTPVSGADPATANNSATATVEVLAQGGLGIDIFRDGFEVDD